MAKKKSGIAIPDDYAEVFESLWPIKPTSKFSRNLRENCPQLRIRPVFPPPIQNSRRLRESFRLSQCR